jgi:hypothetical protein
MRMFVRMSDPRRLFDPKKLGPTERGVLLTLLNAEYDDPLLLSRDLRLRASQAIREAELASDTTGGLKLAVAASVLADLCEQGWDFDTVACDIYITPPSADAADGESVEKVKSRIRRGLMVASNRQISTDAVQEFIRFMERDRVYQGQIISVRCLVDDGADLAEKLGAIDPNGGDVDRTISRIVQPFIQVCDSDAVCSLTGYKLLDIWRYFRHSWALEYNSVPGRTLRFLIRNKARKHWPIIGIAMLASPAANYYVRDHWIGWRLDDVIENIISGKWRSDRIAKALMRVIREAIQDIRTDDLVTLSELENPTEATLFKLRQLAHRAEQERRSDLIGKGKEGSDEIAGDHIVDIRCVDKSALSDEVWNKLSGTSLYRKKRAEQLEILLRCSRFFKEADFEHSPGAALCEVLVTKAGRDAVSIALNEIRKRKLATEVADLSVCGAVPPYNHLLGGKLVALLMASQEVRDLYLQRYEGQVSEIASQIAGRSIVRTADLKILTTTSLYGISSSQYNRLKLKAGIVPKLFQNVEWEELAKTQGMTVTHLSKLTVRYMQQLGEAVYGTRRINSVFGEGSSPRTRQVREGLNLIGISNDSILEQGLPRRVYACEMYPGARTDLHQFDRLAKTRKSQRAAAITQAWIRRWIVRRATRNDILQALAVSRPDMVAIALRERASCAEGEVPKTPNQLELTFSLE